MEAATPEQGIPAGEDTSDAPPFSLELNQDQKDIRDWVHGFAEQTSSARPRPSGTSARRPRGR